MTAVFRSAFYLGDGADLVCVGTAALEPGPINVITAAPAGFDWRACGLRADAASTVASGEIGAGNHVRVALAEAEPWAPDPVPQAFDPVAVARGLAALRAACSGRPITGGVSRFIDPGFAPQPHDHECRAAAAPIARAQAWLDQALANAGAGHREDLDWIDALTGLGSGLTPAGDDFLGGMMISLKAVGHPTLGNAVWRRLRPVAAQATNAISLALLSAASEGLGSASVHRAVSGILRGDAGALGAAIAGLDRIGHSSGWDAMTGIATVLDCWLRSRRVVTG